jgi:hypothetical protein
LVKSNATTTMNSNNNSLSLRRARGAPNARSGVGSTSHRLSMPMTRPPILLSFTSLSSSSFDLKTNVIIEAGHVGQPRWKHCIELSSLSSISTTTTLDVKNQERSSKEIGNNCHTMNTITIDTTTADGYYRIYANTMEHVFHLLGQDSKDRRVVILHPGGLYVQREWKIAMIRLLQEIIGTSAVTFRSTISMVPFALPPTPNNTVLLLVHVTLQEAQCIIFADKIVLDYTFQSCGYPKSVQMETCNNKSSPSLLDVKKMQDAWIHDDVEEHDETTSLVFLILKTLEACPRQLRLYAIHSILFSGNIVDPFFSLMIAKKLELTLKSDSGTSSTSNESKSFDDTTNSNDTRWSYVPFNRKLFLPLAEHISVVKFSPQQIRPDLLPWIGASTWANHWHEQDPDSPQLHWQSLSPIPLQHTSKPTSDQ